MTRKLVVDIIGEVVDGVNDDILTKLKAHDPNIVKINYMYGPPKEIINRLTSWTSKAFVKKLDF